MASFETLLRALTSARISAEVWINGSFTTHKIEPNDIDVVVFVAESMGRAGTEAQKIVVKAILGRQYVDPLPCHSFLAVVYPKGHKNYQAGENIRAYWEKQFCYDRKTEIKGLVTLNTPLP